MKLQITLAATVVGKCRVIHAVNKRIHFQCNRSYYGLGFNGKTDLQRVVLHLIYKHER